MDHLNQNPLEPDQFPLPENDQAQDNLYLEDEPTLPLPAEELNFQQDMLLNEEPQLASAIVEWHQEQPADTNQVPDNHGFTDAYVDQNINVDENAIAFHGMTHPDEPEVDYRSYLYADEPTEESGSEDISQEETLVPQEVPEGPGFVAEQDYFETAEEESVPAEPNSKVRPPRKGRPKRKKGDGLFGLPHLLSTVVWLGLILVIGVSLARLLWVCAADILAFGREDRSVTIVVDNDDDIDAIAHKLYQAGLVRYPGLFKLYAGLTVDEGEISPGTFTLNTMYDYHALVNGMASASSYRAVVEDVLIPEGYSCRQIFELLEEKGICKVEALEEYAASGEFADYWFLEGVERGDKYCLEGYLFPDTYDFYENSTPREALGKMLTGFDRRVDETLRGKLDSLNAHLADLMRRNGKSEQYIADHKFTFHDVVIVASLIEKESGNAAESFNIASVIYNRLYNWGGTPAYLNIDAAIIYAMDGDASHIDTGFDSPYNTYLHTGLTPGPIANPGMSSLEAALNPASTGYYYYVLNPATGQHTFSKTLEEHEKLVEKYRQARAN